MVTADGLTEAGIASVRLTDSAAIMELTGPPHHPVNNGPRIWIDYLVRVHPAD
ncbi:hypothetical protein [Nocardia alni]|uniref:hypothetical protein n=1 Tax=Nocardia alni TaxID=2815723 RepID=UPI001C2513E7|nr:hypothetical protein [Nocardia alni]